MFDTYTKQKTIEDLYEYNQEGVRSLLDNYYKLVEQGTYSYDPMVIVIKLDIERALRSTLLQPNHLSILTMRYALQLSFMEIQLYEGTSIEEAMNLEEKAIQIMVDVLEGTPSDFYQYEDIKPADTLSEHLLNCQQGKVSPYSVSDILLAHMLHLTKHRDNHAKEVLRQRVEGAPTLHQVLPLDIEYPSHNTSVHNKSNYDYFRNQDRKNQVSYDDFANQARGLQVIGRKKIQTSSDLAGNKGMVYEL
ncbi:hypothetical protein U1P98_07590 [Lysinibacillus irui]|uniref:Uncharacterized protein n=1 Tax=Lysinibacillus irui TaxID=2998077 RepID=A0ABU5NJE7_9BACI|nr:hypothetical protein [Lysinibacillus irui]MEA0553778.1 hypothetical protein [Lysinibacillus irui]MEA0976162.1 hypothetical protein [Lysinibacillus irui]MEA1042316.1 hypothetical protein [Lysinibacillus irui]